MTSKEQAEELIRDAVNNWRVNTNPPLIEDVLNSRLPLTELLEVAKAAADYWKHSNPIPGEYKKSQTLDNALSALRATNKIKGL